MPTAHERVFVVRPEEADEIGEAPAPTMPRIGRARRLVTWVIVAAHGRWGCARCGRSRPAPATDLEAEAFVRALRAFAREHAGCREQRARG